MSTHWIKRPKTITQRWSIMRREAGKSVSVKNEALEAVNALWKVGKLDPDQALARVQAVLIGLKKGSKLRAADQSLVNRKLMENYWEEHYATRILVDPDTMYRDLVRAIRAIEPVDLVSASKSELQAKVNRLLPNRARQRRVVARINQLLGYLGRDIRLQAAKTGRAEVSYLTEETLLETLPKLPEPTRLVVAAMFYTGARPGELFAMKVKSEHIVRIPNQVDRTKRVRDTKTMEPRDVLVDPKGWEWVKMFLARRSMIDRNNRHPAFKKATGCVLYDLRHSFAIHMLNRGLSISDVALLLGNSVAVCQQYYLGFVAKPETIEAMKKKLASLP